MGCDLVSFGIVFGIILKSVSLKSSNLIYSLGSFWFSEWNWGHFVQRGMFSCCQPRTHYELVSQQQIFKRRSMEHETVSSVSSGSSSIEKTSDLRADKKVWPAKVAILISEPQGTRTVEKNDKMHWRSAQWFSALFLCVNPLKLTRYSGTPRYS